MAERQLPPVFSRMVSEKIDTLPPAIGEEARKIVREHFAPILREQPRPGEGG